MNIREKIVQIKFIKIKTLFSRKLKPAECIKGNAQQYNNVRDSPILPFSLKKQMMASLFNVIRVHFSFRLLFFDKSDCCVFYNYKHETKYNEREMSAQFEGNGK